MLHTYQSFQRKRTALPIPHAKESPAASSHPYKLHTPRSTMHSNKPIYISTKNTTHAICHLTYNHLHFLPLAFYTTHVHYVEIPTIRPLAFLYHSTCITTTALETVQQNPTNSCVTTASHLSIQSIPSATPTPASCERSCI